MRTVTDEIVNVLTASGTSPWLREALCSALKRDPFEAANDAHRLGELLAGRVEAMLFLDKWESRPSDSLPVLDRDDSRFA